MPQASEILAFLNLTGATNLRPDERPELRNVFISAVSRDSDASEGDLSWLSVKAAADYARAASFKGSLLLVPAESEARSDDPRLLPCVSPKIAFTAIVERFFPSLVLIAWPLLGADPISPDALIAPSATLQHGVVIGPGCVIGDGVVIGPNSCLAFTTVERDVTIGSNCSIGLPGFGYERDNSGQFVRFPHVGRVLLRRGVAVGSNTCIDRGALGDTDIGEGTKIDNLVHIAHNVTLGANVLVIANSMVAGSVTVGDDAWIAPSASILNQLTIGAGAIIGLGAVVVKSVPPRQVVVGNPARPLEKK